VGRRVGEAGPERTLETLAALKLRLGTRLGAAEHYARLRARQMDYGPAFQGVVELWVGEGEALGRVELPEQVNDQGYTLHPALLDACLQVAATLSPDEAATYVPSGIKSLRLRARPPRRAWVVAARRASEETKRGEVRCDLRIVDDEERLLLEIEALCARRVEARAREPRGSELRASLAGISRDEALVLLEQFFAREAGHVLRLPPSRIERSTPFGRLGMDSLMMMELKNRVLAGAGVELSNATLTRYDHVGALASYLLEQLSLEHLLSEVSASAEEATAGEEMESVTL
jgi:acyl carrier protein